MGAKSQLSSMLSGARRVKGLFYGIKFSSRHARESTLLALYAFASSGKQVKRKRVKKP